MNAQHYNDALPIEQADEMICPHCRTEIEIAGMEPFSKVACPSCGKQLTIPAKLGNYILLRQLGAGNMGSVYEGYDTALSRRVAIKVMHASIEEDPEFAEQFLREGRALAALNHPNIVQIYTCGDQDGNAFLVMELVNGGSLDETTDESEQADEAETLRMAVEITKGLQAASGIGLAHGDLKPQNILYDRKGHAKVADFGLARFQGEEIKAGEIWGTPYYIAPEAARGAQPDARTDIYSFGATLFHALAGEPPFEGETAQQTVVARFKQPAPDLKELRPEIHPKTAEVVARMLEQERFKRYPNYDSLLDDLSEAYEAVLKAREEAASKPAQKKRRWPFVLTLAVLLVMAAAAAIAYRSAQKKEEMRKAQASDKTRYVMVNGKIVAVTEGDAPVDDSTQTSAAAGLAEPVRISTRIGNGADAYITGASADKDYSGKRYGHRKNVLVRAGDGTPGHEVYKTYLRFDLSNVDTKNVASVELRLYSLGDRSNGRIADYELSLWGLKDGHKGETWYEGVGPNPEHQTAISWASAPGNALSSPDKAGEDAELLAKVQVPPMIPAGDTIRFTDVDAVAKDKLAQFIQDDSDGLVTFIITADRKTTQSTGWAFASSQHPSLDAPTLILR
jgi:tRNA A-37 threonylcarbamoyl transferase component Bud32/predicted RNA-binding Zn-ribbon protein involved in translation (DUF1610 family)